MPPEKWQLVRNRWETDEHEGFHWIVDEMELPVSAPAVRKKAKTEGWEKRPIKITKRAAEKALAKTSGKKPSPETRETRETNQPKELSEFGAFDDLTPKQELFVRAYLTCFDAKSATIQAGYSEKSAAQQGCNLLNEDKISRAIAAAMRDRIQKMGREADELVKFHLAVLAFDMNELVEHRVHACRHCWGVNHQIQHTPSSWQREREKDEKRREKMSELERAALEDFPSIPPDGWYEAKRGPHADCPECHGDGIGKTVFKDTRRLSPVASLIYAGIKEGKEGTEFLTLQKQKSLDTLSTHLGLNKMFEVPVNVAIVTETANKFDSIMAAARERQRQVLIERGVVIDDG